LYINTITSISKILAAGLERTTCTNLPLGYRTVYPRLYNVYAIRSSLPDYEFMILFDFQPLP